MKIPSTSFHNPLFVEYEDLPPYYVKRLAEIQDQINEVYNPVKSDQQRADDFNETSDYLTQLEGTAHRRHLEKSLADYIQEKVCPITDDRSIWKLPAKLKTCRCSGSVAELEDGRHITLWDHKCSQSRLCPDEARVEQQRIIHKYSPVTGILLERYKRLRLYKAVITTPNVPLGKLREGMDDIFSRLKAMRLSEVDGQLKFKEIKGTISVLESPLSAHNDWNIHLNVFFMVDGRLDFKKLRDHWGYNLEIKQVKGSIDSIIDHFKEAMKYASKITTEKSQEKAESEQSNAPGLLDWPPEAFVEWYLAHKGFRRVRSTGCFYLNKKSREKLKLPQVVTRRLVDSQYTLIGRIRYSGSAYTHSKPPLGFRQGDKFTTKNTENCTGPP